MRQAPDMRALPGRRPLLGRALPRIALVLAVLLGSASCTRTLAGEAVPGESPPASSTSPPTGQDGGGDVGSVPVAKACQFVDRHTARSMFPDAAPYHYKDEGPSHDDPPERTCSAWSDFSFTVLAQKFDIDEVPEGREQELRPERFVHDGTSICAHSGDATGNSRYPIRRCVTPDPKGKGNRYLLVGAQRRQNVLTAIVFTAIGHQPDWSAARKLLMTAVDRAWKH